MRAYIEWKGKEYLVEAISWKSFGEEGISHVSFHNEKGEYVTVHDESTKYFVDNERFYADLQEIVHWKEK